MKITWFANLLIFSAVASAHAQPVWLEPVKIYEPYAEPALLHPVIAASSQGHLAMTFTSVSGHTSGTIQFLYPAHWESNVYTMFSADRGNTWSAPQMISHPSLHNSQPDVTGGSQPGEFYFTWASGDAFSGYRQHIAKTTDGGNTYTSSTRVQNFLEPAQGVVYPDIEMTGDTPIVNWSAVNQDKEGRPYGWYTSKLGTDIDSWSEPVGLDTPASTQPLALRRPIATGGSTVIAAGSETSSSMEFPGPRVFIVRSDNGGTSWSQPVFTATDPEVYSRSPSITTDGKGTWVMHFFGSTSPYFQGQRFGRPYFQRSVDDGLTWSSAERTTSSAATSSDTPIGIATDEDGRWIAASFSDYIFSDDNGLTWSEWQPMPDFHIAVNPGQITYLGDGKWGLLERRWTSPAGVYLRTLQWGPSIVNDWTLY